MTRMKLGGVRAVSPTGVVNCGGEPHSCGAVGEHPESQRTMMPLDSLGQHNPRILARLTCIVSWLNARLFALYGQDHNNILRDQVIESPDNFIVGPFPHWRSR